MFKTPAKSDLLAVEEENDAGKLSWIVDMVELLNTNYAFEA